MGAASGGLHGFTITRKALRSRASYRITCTIMDVFGMGG